MARARAQPDGAPTPTVMRVARDAKNPAITVVRVAGGRGARVATVDAEALGLRVGLRVDGTLRDALRRAADYARLHRLAMGWVNRAALSRAVLERKAQAKGFEHTVVARLVAEFERIGLIDDPRLAREGAHAIVNRRPAGEPLIVARLTRRGVDEDEARRAADGALRGRDALADAVSLVRARLGRSRTPAALNTPQTRRRLLGLLARRGFDEDTAREAVDRVLGREEES